ncbi:MAG: nitroreductase family protein [Candidatus Electrothrix sp. GW3-4]|uniref:nitroreductase family protein n=1 Tax=Candidatus Electrothrix sp. GW3-4 TaxID=3126740 RepID=UPI0030D10F36
MEIFEALHTRRSIRKYTEGDVGEEIVWKILAAAMCAPSAGNEQPWQFVVIRERTLLDSIPEFHPHASMVRQASLGILVCGDTRLEKYKGFWVQDCSAATQNLLLAAHGAGLGAVWTGVHPDKGRERGFRHLLGLPEEVVPFSFVPLGPVNQQLARKDIFLEERVHMNRWHEEE